MTDIRRDIMSNEFEINAELRTDLGKGSSRRLRRLENKVPAIVYGTEKEPVSISLLEKELKKSLMNEAFYSHILTLNIGGESQQVVLKDLQRHPAKETVLHADFLRVDENHKIHMTIPLHFLNEAQSQAVKLQGGIVSHQMSNVEIACMPKDLPEFIEVDLIDLELGQIVHLSDLKLPEGVEIVALAHGADHDSAVATVHKPKGVSEEEEGAAAEGEEAPEASE